MIGDLGAPEILIIGILVLVLFGAGKLTRLGGDLGTAIKDFRRAMKDEEGESPAVVASSTAPAEAVTQQWLPPASGDAAPAISTNGTSSPPHVF